MVLEFDPISVSVMRAGLVEFVMYQCAQIGKDVAKVSASTKTLANVTQVGIVHSTLLHVILLIRLQ